MKLYRMVFSLRHCEVSLSHFYSVSAQKLAPEETKPKLLLAWVDAGTSSHCVELPAAAYVVQQVDILLFALFV